MSLPSSEHLPNDIHDLPPARQRHIRRQPRLASLAERQILLNSLVKLSAPTPAFFLRSLLGVLALGIALYLSDPIILIVAIVILPFNSPLFGLALFANTLQTKHALKSLVSLLILLSFIFGAGALSGLLGAFPKQDPLHLYRFSALYWLDLVVLGVSVMFSALVLLRQGKIPNGAGVLLSYTLLIPFAVVGYGLTNGQTQLWSGALIVSFAHLGLSIVLAVIAFLTLGFPPRKTLGWLVAIFVLLLTLAVFSAGLNPSLSQALQTPTASPTSILVISLPSPTPKGPTIQTPSATPTLTANTATWTTSPSPTNTPSATPTPTPEPTAYWGVVDSVLGAIIREDHSFDAPIATYANNGDQIEILGEQTPQGSSRWFFVRTSSGETGWMLGSLINTQTPTPAD